MNTTNFFSIKRNLNEKNLADRMRSTPTCEDPKGPEISEGNCGVFNSAKKKITNKIP